MGNKIFKIAILSLAAIASVFFVGMVLAQTGAIDTADIQYPVPELGNCKNEAECRSFCDKPENLAVCLDFAEENNLMSDEELEMARKFLDAGGVGPGGCTSEDTCEAYCNDISHIDECISFAEQSGMMPPGELEEAKKVQAAIKRGVQPPSCGNKKACDSYCEEPEHMEECIVFAKEAGFLSDQELGEAQKVLQAIKRGVKPPPCRGREACDEYCGQPDNMEACMNFALEAGLMGEQEREDAQKMLSAMKKGIKPPNCRGKEECDTYCQDDTHFDECMNFAEAAGFMDPKEAEMARKTRGKGPGECRSKEACESFCNDPANQEACFKFAEEHGLVPEEQIKEMKDGMSRLQGGLENAPPEVRDCLKSVLGENIIDKIQSGELTPGPQIGDQMKGCFEKFPPREMGSPGMMPPGENGRPPEGFQPPQPGGFGPGSAEECSRYGGDWDGERCGFGARECTNQGGSWDGQICNFPEGLVPPAYPGSPATDTRPKAGEDFDAQECTNQGGDWIGGKCDFGRRECANQGGSWDGVKCNFINPLDTPEYCINQGGSWNGSRCDFGARECTNQGGEWYDNSCNFKQPPPPSSFRNQPFLGAIIRFLLGDY